MVDVKAHVADFDDVTVIHDVVHQVAVNRFGVGERFDGMAVRDHLNRRQFAQLGEGPAVIPVKVGDEHRAEVLGENPIAAQRGQLIIEFRLVAAIYQGVAAPAVHGVDHLIDRLNAEDSGFDLHLLSPSRPAATGRCCRNYPFHPAFPLSQRVPAGAKQRQEGGERDHLL